MKFLGGNAISKLLNLINSKFLILAPVGVVQAFSGSTVPSGWLLCDGSAISRTTYSQLFSIIGTTYGTGNGSSTFNLPNLTDKFIEGGSTSGTYKSAGLPNITGDFHVAYGSVDRGNGALYVSASQYTSACNTGSGTENNAYFDASRSSSIYGSSSTVQPPALIMKYIIKY